MPGDGRYGVGMTPDMNTFLRGQRRRVSVDLTQLPDDVAEKISADEAFGVRIALQRGRTVEQAAGCIRDQAARDRFVTIVEAQASAAALRGDT